jgi:hypothetical protein
MLNEVNVSIKLIRTIDAFCLIANGATQFIVVVTFASLLIRQVVCRNQSVSLAGARKNPRDRDDQISH